ncbi:MAG: SMP-30/gluconolactonase/LRE family protein, partial [Aquisalimonadaceae bacterium]
MDKDVCKGVAACFLGLVVLAVWGAGHALFQSPSAEADRLWVTEQASIRQLDGMGQPLLRLDDLQNVTTVAVDPRRQRVWAYGEGRLIILDADGDLLAEQQLFDAATAEIGPPTHTPHWTRTTNHLAVDSASGRAWLAADDRLYRFTDGGMLEQSLALAEPATALAIDPAEQRLWVGSASGIAILNGENGTQMTGFHTDTPVLAIAFDAAHSRAWVADADTLSRHAPDGNREQRYPIRQAYHLVSDGEGGVWVGGRHRLRRLHASGLVKLDLPWVIGRGRLGFIGSMTRAADDGVWLAGRDALVHIDGEGRRLAEVSIDNLPYPAALTAIVHVRPPIRLTWEAPETGAYVNTGTPTLVFTPSRAVKPDLLRMELAGEPLAVDCQTDSERLRCQPREPLQDGEVQLSAAIQAAGFRYEPAQRQFTVDTRPPVVTLLAPADGFYTNASELLIHGDVDEPAQLTLNGEAVALADDRTFEHLLVLEEGANALAFHAEDRAGNSATLSRTVMLDTLAPALPLIDLISIELLPDGTARITGEPGSVEPHALVHVTNLRTGETVSVRAGPDGSFQVELHAEPVDALEIRVEDAAGNRSEAGQINLFPDGSGGLPRDPAVVAPPLPTNGVTALSDAVRFLYTGTNPIQRGMAPGVIEARRVAVVRGRVLNRDGALLAGVRITIHRQPELGHTLSRADGAFDMAVNGGGTLTVDYQKDGYLPVQRQVHTPWQDYAWVDDVVMVQLDAGATEVSFSGASGYQIARGGEVEDAAGRRQATLLFPANVNAELVLADGSRTPLTSGTVRATEYTVGANGFQAMPGDLPPTTAYTYAVELSLDEAIAAGAEQVVFSQPVPLYVDNFLDFPTGEIVPAGYYDRGAALWRAGDNGRVIEILGIEGGVAMLDVMGEGNAATQSELDALGITDSERAQLAGLYSAGKTLWRTPIPHFTPWDCNWPAQLPADADVPRVDEPETNDKDEPENSEEEQECDGCVISPQRQILGEHMPVTGTPFELVYRSDRAAGYKNKFARISLSGEHLPASVETIRLDISIAGQHISRTFSATPNSQYVFEWDGLDGYGREIVGTREARIAISYHYPCVYTAAVTGGGAGSGAMQSWARSGSLEVVGTRSDCQSMALRRNWSVSLLSPYKIRPNTVGVWSLNVHHAYDPTYQVLHLGNGARRALQTRVIHTVAGTGNRGYSGDGGPATAARLAMPADVAVDAAGHLYIADSWNHRIRRVSPDGVITTLAGTGNGGYAGDGGPATAAQLRHPDGVAVDAAGHLYIADFGNHRIRRVSPDGVITTVAGTGIGGYSGDGGPAAAARLYYPSGVAIDAAGYLYIADEGNYRIRRVSPDGVITTVAGNGNWGQSGDGGPATEAPLVGAGSVTVDAAGHLYIADSWNHRIRRVGPDGMITTVAGTGNAGFSGDDGPAAAAQLNNPAGVAVDAAGYLYIADVGNGRIRRVSPDGVITTVAGTDNTGFAGDGGPATAAWFSWPRRIAVDAAGHLYIADGSNERIRRVRLGYMAMSALAANSVPSADGTRLYTFDTTGRHLATVDTISGAAVYEFDYDAAGRLITVTDGDGNLTRLERDASGHATAIIAPDGQRTELAVDTRDHLNEVTNAAGHRWSMAYTSDGLLTRFENPNGQATTFAYSEEGRLIRDDMPNGGGWQISRTPLADGYRTEMTSGEGRISGFTVRRSALSEREYLDEAPDGAVTQRTYTDIDVTVIRPDGTVLVREQGSDPRFGMMAPLTASQRISTPGGLTAKTTMQREAVLNDPLDPLSHSVLTETVTVNGRSRSAAYEAATRSWTMSSAEGRIGMIELTAQGRPARTSFADLAPLAYSYDARGRLTGLASGEGSGQRRTHVAYDAAGHVERVTDALDRTAHYAYDLVGRLTRQTLPDGRAIQYSYDARGNLTGLMPPGRDAHLFDYDAVDQPTDYRPPELPEGGTVTRYRYNLDKQLTEVERPDGQTVAFAYDGGGRLVTLGLPRGQYGYSYHPTTGKLHQITTPDGGALSYTFDGFLPLTETWAGPVRGTVSRTHNADFRLTRQCVNGSRCVNFSYDADGLLTGAGDLALSRSPASGLLTGTALGGVATAESHNAFGEPAAYTATGNGAPLAEFGYSRDLLGRLTGKTELIAGESR